MSTPIDNGGPAFPSQPIMRMPESTQMVINQGGMSLRDYFAAKAMHALVVEPPWAEGSTASVHKWSEGFAGSNSMDRFAFASYAMADAMLKARTQP